MPKPTVWLTLAVLLAVFAPIPSLAQPEPAPVGFTPVGRWTTGPSLCLAKDGYVVYLGNGASLLTVDVADPTQPTALDRIDLPSAVMDCVIHDGLLYVATMGGEFIVIDAHDPQHLSQRGQVDAGAGSAWSGLALGDGVVYWALNQLQVVDISNPDQPRLSIVDDCPGSGYARDATVGGGFLYTAGGCGTIVSYDISAPASPILISSLDLMTYGTSVHAHDDRLYCGTLGGPGYSPIVAGELSALRAIFAGAAGVTNDFAVRDSVTFTATMDFGVQCGAGDLMYYDEYQSTAYDLELDGDFLYTAHGRDGLVIYDVTDASRPQIVGNLGAGGEIADFELSGDQAYLAVGRHGIDILDLADPTSPVLVGGHRTFGQAESPDFEVQEVSARGTDLLLLGAAGFQIVDVQTPSAPRLVIATTEIEGTFTSQTNRGIALSDKWLFSGNNIGAVTLDLGVTEEIDGSPVSWPTAAIMSTWSADGDRVYASDNTGSFWILAAGAGGAMTVLGPPTEVAAARIIASTHNLVCLAHEGGEFTLIGVTDPTAPRVLAQLTMPPGSWQVLDLAITESAVYFVNAYEGLWRLDRDGNDALTIGGFFPVPDNPQAIAVRDDLIYVASRFGGLHVLRDSAVATSPGVRPALALKAAPNPFNPMTRIAFATPNEGPVTVDIFDVGGRRVKRVLDAWLTAGPHTCDWSGRDNTGRAVAAGAYLVRCQAGAFSRAIKVTVAK